MSPETLSGEGTVVQLCRVFGLSRQAFCAARGGHQPPHVARPRRSPWPSAETLHAPTPPILQGHPSRGPRKVWATLRRHGVLASHKPVWAVMPTLGLTLPRGTRRRARLARSPWTAATPAGRPS